MASEDALSKVQAELDTYAATKAAFKAAIASKGLTPTDVFASYAPLIESITGGTVTVQDSKTVTFNGVTVEVGPDEGYDGIRKVILSGDPNLKALNIVDAITMYGVIGSAKVAVSEDWPDDLPITPDEPVGPAQEIDPDLPDDAETWDYFILSQNDGNITLGIMYDDFEITSYDPASTNFSAKGWIRVSKHTTGDKAGQTLAYDFRTNASEGGNFLRNIRSCTRAKLYYQGVEIWPTTWITTYDGEITTRQSMADGTPYYSKRVAAIALFEEGDIVRVTLDGETTEWTAQFVGYATSGSPPTEIKDCPKYAVGNLSIAFDGYADNGFDFCIYTNPWVFQDGVCTHGDFEFLPRTTISPGITYDVQIIRKYKR